MNQLSKKSTNSEIQATFGAQVATGNPFIFAIEPTKNPDYVSLYVAQELTTPGSATLEQQLMLGWGDQKTIVRCRPINFRLSQTENFKKVFGAAPTVGLELGKSCIKVTEDNVQGSWIDAAGERQYESPKVYPAGHKDAGKKILDPENGKEIYRHTEWVLAPANTVKHTFIQGVPEGSEEALAAEVKSSFNELATA